MEPIGMLRRRPLILVVAAALAQFGCAVGPDFRPPTVALPEGFAKPAVSVSPAAAGRPAQMQAVEVARWWHALGDPELDALVDRALKDNPSLEIALDRLQQARTFEVAVTGFALPRLEASAGGARGTGSDLTRGRVPGALGSADHTINSASRINEISGFDAAWDIDVFGRLRRGIEAARYDAQAAAAARDAAQVAVVCDVVRAYVDLRGLQVQLAVLRQNLEAARQLMDLVQARFDRGITNELDLTIARRQYATVEAGIAPLEAGIDAARNALAVLVGRFPEEMDKELATPGMIPAVPERIDPGLPLDLIRRRPDIREAEWDLAGATARVGIATANLFPQLAITGGSGLQGQGLGYSPASTQKIWSLGYAAAVPLLDFGVLDAFADIADLQARERLASYKLTVLRAVQDVDSSMAAFQAQQSRLSSLGEAVIASQRAMALATERYDRGLTDFLNVVDAQRQEYDLEGQYAFTQMTMAEQFVGVYRALGGGWEQYDGPPQIRTPQPAIVAMFRRLIQPGSAR
jgi:NodT family efflux transporter outer membrane factor (OMF) lipoprotein